MTDSFSQCSIDGLDRLNENILVFDQEFIQRNFYINKDLDGIFSLDEKNEEIDEKIKNENEKISTITNNMKMTIIIGYTDLYYQCYMMVAIKLILMRKCIIKKLMTL